jgi:ribulose-5-phosphate 4-epimerase/fuculose-1-phosphate aldolase
MYYLEASCSIQVRAQAGGGELIPVAKEVLDQAVSRTRQGPRVWPGLLRRLDRLDPSYKN